jgi:hypothetical protein
MLIYFFSSRTQFTFGSWWHGSTAVEPHRGHSVDFAIIITSRLFVSVHHQHTKKIGAKAV